MFSKLAEQSFIVPEITKLRFFFLFKEKKHTKKSFFVYTQDQNVLRTILRIQDKLLEIHFQGFLQLFCCKIEVALKTVCDKTSLDNFGF